MNTLQYQFWYVDLVWIVFFLFLFFFSTFWLFSRFFHFLTKKTKTGHSRQEQTQPQTGCLLDLGFQPIDKIYPHKNAFLRLTGLTKWILAHSSRDWSNWKMKMAYFQS